MVVGDIKDERAIVIPVIYGDTVTKGQVIHEETDGKWDPGALADTGNKAVAIDSGVDTGEGRAVIWGAVEVTNDDAIALRIGNTVGAGAAGDASYNITAGQAFATVMEPIAADGIGTIWVGLVR